MLALSDDHESAHRGPFSDPQRRSFARCGLLVLFLIVAGEAAAIVSLALRTHDEPTTPLATSCDVSGIFNDMHDGDQKNVSFSTGRGTITILPYGNSESWVVQASLDIVHCNASVDFNVPGKPNPPPINLTATLWTATRAGTPPQAIAEVVFTDPTGTLAPPAPSGLPVPLNAWIKTQDS
jgi:hypothetical protein